MHRNSPQKRTQRVEKPPGTVKFVRKLFPGHQRVAVYRNISQKRAQRVEKPPGTVKTALQTMICDEIVSWASTCRGAPKLSSETCSARRKPSGTVKTALQTMIGDSTRQLATNQLITHPAIKDARHWATKGTFFENVVFLGILLSVQ